MNDAAAPDTEAGSGPGPLLRSAREAQGLSEQQAAEQLNLDVSVVVALERDDLAALGAPVFAKGHLRRYGAMLGVVEDQLLEAYERARAQPEVPTLIPRARQEMMPVRGRPKWPWVLGGALLFLVAAGLAAYLSEYGLRRSSDEPRPAAAVAGSPAGEATAPSAPASGAVAPATATAGTVPDGGVAAPAPVTASPMPVPPGHVSVSLAFSADSWAEIYDGSGKAVLYDLGRAGTQRTIAAAAPLSVALGNAPAATMAVNGRAATIPAAAGGGTVARFKIEADGTVR